MLHTPLKHVHPAAVGHGHGHAPAQHAQPASARCTPHAQHPHELNLADWLHMSPAQVAMMSPVAAPYTPPNALFVPTPSPLQYAAAVANANARNDFLATSSLSYSSPFQVDAHYPHPNPYTANPNFQQVQIPTIAISAENAQQMHVDPLTEASTRQGLSSSPGPGPADASLLLSLATEYFPYSSGSAPSSSSSTSPVSHRGSPFPYEAYMGPAGEGESTPVTTLSGADDSQTQSQLQTSAPEHGSVQHLIDRLRGASPVTDASNSVSGSPERPSKTQSRPVESVESPFRIAAPQPRTGSGPFSPLPPSSRPTSALGALSELAELASRRSTPSHPLAHSSLASPAPHSRPVSRLASRPTSALSTRSTVSYAKAPKLHRKQPLPHRFAPSMLRVALPYMQTPTSSTEGNVTGKQLTPSFIDGLARGPLEFEEEGHRYRTRSKLRSFKTEIQEREREADLLLIRRGLRGESASAESGLEMLASVSVGLDSPAHAEMPMPNQTQGQRAMRLKKGAKRAFRDLDDGDCESVASSNGSRSRTPSKRPRVTTEKAAKAVKGNVKKEQAETVVPRAHMTRASREKAPVRSSSARAPSQRNKKTASPPKNAKASSTPAAKKIEAKKVVEMEVDESDLSSLSSMSETEDAKSSMEDTDYAPKKTGRTSRSKAASASTSAVKASVTKSASKANAPAKAKSTPIDTENGAAAIAIPVRTFAPDVPLHASFPLLYRKFPLCGYTDPNSFSFAPLGGALSSTSNAASESESAALPVPSSGHFNAPRSAEDLYTPRFVRGVGRDKMGLCPICYESTERGGAGRTEWLSMKFSAFNYHMQYAHGISPITALPFSPPIAFRSVVRTPNHKNEKNEILEGKCHRCEEWAPVEGVKCVEAKLKEIYWWKHAAACHKGSTMPGECDAHLEDAVSKRVKASYDIIQARAHSAVPVAALSLPKELFTTAPLY